MGIATTSLCLVGVLAAFFFCLDSAAKHQEDRRRAKSRYEAAGEAALLITSAHTRSGPAPAGEATMDQAMAVKRLLAEYRSLTENPPDGVTAGPVDEDNFFEWEALISGPEDTIYEGALFKAHISFPKTYPMQPPKMKFESKMWHPNVYPNGNVCISILHAPGDDPMQYESGAERWSPAQSVESVLVSVMSMLAEPNIDSPANVDAAVQYRDEREAYEEAVMATVEASLLEEFE